jgi:hypothetical protein
METGCRWYLRVTMLWHQSGATPGMRAQEWVGGRVAWLPAWVRSGVAGQAIASRQGELADREG